MSKHFGHKPTLEAKISPFNTDEHKSKTEADTQLRKKAITTVYSKSSV